jgi:glucan phosphoethanolaminetransferase (alkaline phosphatase superfamily)
MSEVQTSTVPNAPETPVSSGLSALAKTTAIATLANSLAYFVDLVLVLVFGKVFISALLILGLVTLVAAGVSFLRFRFAPAISALVVLASATGTFAVPINQYHITHPSEAATFIIDLIILAFAVAAVVAGIAATLQNYRSLERPTPPNLRLLLTSFTTFVIGMVVVSLIAAANPSTSTASTTTSGEPAVHMSPTSFVQNVVLVPKGSKLLLVDDGSYDHVLQNGFWQNTTQHNQAEAGAPTVRNVNINGGSVEIGPFTTAGIYHIYCSIHVGMNLTVVVQ